MEYSTLIAVIAFADFVFFLVAGVIIYHKSRPIYRDKYNLRKMYEKNTGEKYETKKYLKWLSGTKILLLSLFISACASLQPTRKIESIDTIHVFHYNNSQWLRGITPFEPDTSKLIYHGQVVRWLGDTAVNFPSYIMYDTIRIRK